MSIEFAIPSKRVLLEGLMSYGNANGYLCSARPDRGVDVLSKSGHGVVFVYEQESDSNLTTLMDQGEDCRISGHNFWCWFDMGRGLGEDEIKSFVHDFILPFAKLNGLYVVDESGFLGGERILEPSVVLPQRSSSSKTPPVATHPTSANPSSPDPTEPDQTKP